ncbi:MAG: hypothetical protein QGI24_10970, partial [Kiritimatiellia bacterium]|nr:hypothetical protein [Kiritimatiellia bacterium]
TESTGWDCGMNLMVVPIALCIYPISRLLAGTTIKFLPRFAMDGEGNALIFSYPLPAVAGTWCWFRARMP